MLIYYFRQKYKNATKHKDKTLFFKQIFLMERDRVFIKYFLYRKLLIPPKNITDYSDF